MSQYANVPISCAITRMVIGTLAYQHIIQLLNLRFILRKLFAQFKGFSVGQFIQ